ncbi:T9SS type A sorting domain-containing protein [uncultured Winogradskyella sp.]|uniref:T9SS type A sorting domain-containing protein n=1 Tax=uncultured Winogradskyella sp. TaxID=395353 RepID=UPI00260419B8|nr:T9SS type A sorting domain-containing protein [uncultured Winogradskyella sp.]
MRKITFNFKSLFAYLFLVSSLFLSAQETTFVPQKYTPTEPGCVLPLGEFAGLVSVPRAPETAAKMKGGGNPCATFVVSYNGFTPEAQAAFQYAVDIWANSIDSSVPINVNASFTALGPNVLGSAGPATFLTSSAPGSQPNIFYPAAIWEKLEGADRSTFGGSNDITANFSSEANWYYGTDANPPGNQIDFVTVVLHELGHGLGFIGFSDVTTSFPDDIGAVREPNNNIPAVYDAFVENGTGAAILSFPDPSAALGTELVSNDLFINAPTSVAQFGQGGALPQIYAPASFNGGSSIYHWNTPSFPIENINSLMRHEVGPGSANHNPGPITLGLFQDMGWSICPGALSVDDIRVYNVSVGPNPFKSAITIKLSNGFNDEYNISLWDINGRRIIDSRETVENGAISISNLNQLEDAIYFLKVTNETTGTSIVKKIIKN